MSRFIDQRCLVATAAAPVWDFLFVTAPPLYPRLLTPALREAVPVMHLQRSAKAQIRAALILETALCSCWSQEPPAVCVCVCVCV